MIQAINPKSHRTADHRFWRILHHGLLSAVLAAVFLFALSGIKILFLPAANSISSIWLYRSVAVLSTTLGGCVLVLRSYLWIRGRWKDTSLATYRIAFYLIMACFVTLWIFSQSPDAKEIFLVMYSAYGLFALILLLEKPLSNRLPATLRKVLDLALLHLCLLIVLGEAALRLLAFHHPSPLLITASDSTQSIMDRFRFPPGQIRYGFPVNATGHYDADFLPKRQGEFLVVCIGDSFSPGTVPHHFHFTTVCERKLPGINCYNMGISGLGPCGYLYLLATEALPLKPDLIVINLFIGNDIAECNRRKKVGMTWLSFFDRDNVLLCVVPPRILRMIKESRELGRRAGTREGEDIDVCPDSESPETLREQLPWLDDPLREKPSITLEAFLELEKRRASCISWNNKNLYPRFFDTMGDIRNAAGDIPMAVMLIPDNYQVEDVLWDQIHADLNCPSADRFFPQGVIIPWLEEQGIPYLDLLPALRVVPVLSDGQRHVYDLQGTHFNARGNKIAGECLAEFLASRWYVPSVSKDQ